jgi:hypothetical protein
VSNGTAYTTRDDRVGLVLAFLDLKGYTAKTIDEKYKLLRKFKREQGIPSEMRKWIAEMGL